jgi:hypothetical protein
MYLLMGAMSLSPDASAFGASEDPDEITRSSMSGCSSRNSGRT